MKQIILKSLTMTNFKGEKERTTVFLPKQTTIAGKNGIGKSRHFDAFLWLLFGKDAQDRKDYEVKTRLANGEELHKVDSIVEGTLIVDGEDIVLKRVLSENWVKPRGQAEQVFKGNETSCYWNGAPIKVSEYDKRIASIIDKEVFKMVTNPTYFCAMDWKNQREVLFQLAGKVTDEEVAGNEQAFVDLLKKLNGKSFTDYKAELNATKRRLKAELGDIQPRIDQTERMKPTVEANEEEVNTKISELDGQIGDIDKQLASFLESERAKRQDEADMIGKIAQIKRECAQLIDDANEAERKRVAQANAQAELGAMEKNRERRNLEVEIEGLEKDIQRYDKTMDDATKRISDIYKEVETIRKKQDALREEWRTINAQEYNGETICPHCGQQLPADMIAQAKEKFMEMKHERLAENNEQGEAISQKIAELGEEEMKCDNEILKAKKAKMDTLALVKEKRMQHANLEEVKFERQVAKVFTHADIPEWEVKQAEVKELENKLSHVAEPTDNPHQSLIEEKARLGIQRDQLKQVLSDLKMVERVDHEIVRLEEEGRRLAQQIADIEGEEYTLQNFTRARIDLCESKINHLFHYVTFRLFNYTIDGNLVETCEAMIDGVPYGSANTASKINAGLDIINALSEHFGVNAPIFFDNAESVLTLIPTSAQKVLLKVTADEEMTIY